VFCTHKTHVKNDTFVIKDARLSLTCVLCVVFISFCVDWHSHFFFFGHITSCANFLLTLEKVCTFTLYIRRVGPLDFVMSISENMV